MAQKSYVQALSPDVPLTGNVNVKQMGLVHDPDTSPPRISIFLQVQAAGGANVTLGTIGRFRAYAEYTDGTEADIVTSDAPFSSYTIPYQTAAWVLIHSNGKFAAEPAPADNSTISSDERFNLTANKLLRKVKFCWTEDD